MKRSLLVLLLTAVVVFALVFNSYTQECFDNDGDGYGDPDSIYCTYPGWDCDDGNPDVNPGNLEGPDGDPTCHDTLDNDCDNEVDLDDMDCIPCVDDDGDGYGYSASGNCTYPGLDCDDSNPDVTDCDDSNACTNDDCLDHQCQHSAVNCDDGNECTVDSCDSVTGCVNTCLPLRCSKHYSCVGEMVGTCRESVEHGCICVYGP